MREWESLAQMGAGYLKLRADSEFRDLWDWSVQHDLFSDLRGELYSAITMETKPGETL